MFKVGDTVTIRYHSQDEKDNYKYVWIPEMDEMEGETYTIGDIRGSCYIVKETGWSFVESSFVRPYDQF